MIIVPPDANTRFGEARLSPLDDAQPLKECYVLVDGRGAPSGQGMEPAPT
jgi:hypothetical protein